MNTPNPNTVFANRKKRIEQERAVRKIVATFESKDKK